MGDDREDSLGVARFTRGVNRPSAWNTASFRSRRFSASRLRSRLYRIICSMKLSRVARFLIVVVTFWTTLVWAEVPGVHTCAVHSPTTQSPSGQHHASHSHSPRDSNAPHKDQCTCPGTQCGTSLYTAVLSGTVSEGSADVHLEPEIIPPGVERLPRALEFRTVFPNGPPSRGTRDLPTAA